MDIQKYKDRLTQVERDLLAQATRSETAAREQTADSPGDVGDASVIDEGQAERFTESALDASVLQQVRDALQRIADGTFGLCAADGAPIPEARLAAVPWARYCAPHQAALEAASGLRTPTM